MGLVINLINVDRQEFAKQIQELLGANLIEPSESPHFSPVRGTRNIII